MLAGIKLEMAERYSQEIADQLLGETEELLSDLTKEYRDFMEVTWFLPALGRICLRLAEVRARLEMPTREITSALRQARQLAERGRDGEALSYLDRLFAGDQKR